MKQVVKSACRYFIRAVMHLILRQQRLRLSSHPSAHLHPKLLRGWANYYKHVVSRKVFGDLDHAFWQMTWKWARRRLPNKYKGWVKGKYYRRIKGRDWRFVEKGNTEPLILSGPTRLIRHTKIRAQVNPYDPAWADYLKARWKRRQLSGVATRLINA